MASSKRKEGINILLNKISHRDLDVLNNSEGAIKESDEGMESSALGSVYEENPEESQDCSSAFSPAAVPPRPASRLSFALSASNIKEKARVVAMDLRGHGKSATNNDLDLMGGSVAVHVAARKVIPNLYGLVVVDVVEGTAMASLIHMQKILSNRMQFFPTIEKAIEWSVKGGPLRNVDSARVSVPSTLKFDESKKWYEGLSEKFLSCPVPKLLLLAGTDRLDRPLTIGQMQGKFQMLLIRHTGHAIQLLPIAIIGEDAPEEFASHILNFISRNRIGPNGVEVSVSENAYPRSYSPPSNMNNKPKKERPRGRTETIRSDPFLHVGSQVDGRKRNAGQSSELSGSTRRSFGSFQDDFRQSATGTAIRRLQLSDLRVLIT
ncbi:protein phosphatase methylesterase 1 [Apostasia shenzhenica]|uniref:Protein phosphatase methylesterase 1 n=1 Tax=Apostasia shenzhenica TaxID=1088818 RepID=A0A2I0ANR4_9ASPA|nr:protein phosphatase methylesterase 1 [Apostasia shenzhenica]